MAKHDQTPDQDAVQVTANGKSGYAEEKNVSYRKEKLSSESVEPTESEPSNSNPDSGSNSTIQTKYDGANHKRAKLMFNTIMDAHVEYPLKNLNFSWNQEGDMSFNICGPKTNEKN